MCAISQSRGYFTVFLILFPAYISILFAQNLPPVISAGEDAEYPNTQGAIYLEASLSDDSTPEEQLEITWRQLEGPVTVEIPSPNTQFSIIFLTEIGDYTFQLAVSDGELTARDSVVITIRESLEFKILTPADSGEIPIGMPYTITWQREPQYPCQVFYSLDDGVTLVDITIKGAVETGKVIWNVDSSFVPGTQGILIVQKYQTPDDFTQTFFILVEKQTSIRHENQPCIHRRSFSPRFNVTALTDHKKIAVYGKDMTAVNVCGRRLERVCAVAPVIEIPVHNEKH
jgi:hypothetical protein